MGGKGPSGTTTTVQNTSPWGPQQPYLTDIFTNASGLYAGGGPSYYPEATYAPINPWQTGGLDLMAGATNSTLPGTAASFNEGLLTGDYLAANPALAPLSWLANTNAGYGAPGDAALQFYLSGERLNMDNPYTDALSNSILSRVVPKIQSQFIGSGTLSSPEAARASTEGATSAISPYLFQQYQQEEQNQINAANALSGRYLQGAGLMAQAGGMLSDSWNTGVSDMLKGLALAPQTLDGLYAPGRNLLQAGTSLQQLQQGAINDAVARWNWGQTLPYDMLNQYIGQVTGNYGGTTSMTQPYFSNTGMNMLGGGVAGASLGNMFFPGTMGAMGGAGLGSLFALLSDRRAKEAVRVVGMLHNGLPVYAFRYLGSPRTHIGLMADEVENVHPEAVHEGMGGLKMVDYAAAVQ